MECTSSVDQLPETTSMCSTPGHTFPPPSAGVSAWHAPDSTHRAVGRCRPAGEVTLLFSDVAGSTRLLRRLGSEGYARVLSAQKWLLRSAFRSRQGKVADTAADGCVAVFEHAPSAAAAAVTAQHALAMYPWPEGVQVRVRMGLHTGEPLLCEDDYVGVDVHHAARICAAAQGGQILVSRATRELIERDLPAETYLVDLKPHRLEDLDYPARLSELRMTSLPHMNPHAWAEMIP